MTLTELKEKITTNWKNYLIAGGIFLGILIASNVATGIGCYCKGTKTCKPTEPTVVKPSEKPKETTTFTKPVNKGCGDKIELTAKMINNKKIEITGKDTCKQTIKYFDLVYSCPVTKNQLGFAPGLYVIYTDNKIYLAPGGAIMYQRLFGNFGVGAMIQGWGTTQKDLFGGSANIMLSYKW